MSNDPNITKDDAGNVNFKHNGKKYRLLKFNWRRQRQVLNWLLPLQTEEGNTKVFGDDVSDVQDNLFAITQININSTWVLLTPDNADSYISDFKEATALYEKILEVATPFLVDGGKESSPQNSQLQQEQKAEATTIKPKPISS